MNKRRRHLRNFFRACAAMTILAVLVLLWFCAAPRGQQMLARHLAERLSAGMDGGLSITNVSGLLPFYGNIGAIRVFDAEGEWMQVDNLCWRIRRLTLKQSVPQLSFDPLKLERLHLLRRPSGSEKRNVSGPPFPFALDLALLHIGSLRLPPDFNHPRLPDEWEVHAKGHWRVGTLDSRVIVHADNSDRALSQSSNVAVESAPRMVVATRMTWSPGDSGSNVIFHSMRVRIPQGFISGSAAYQPPCWDGVLQADLNGKPFFAGNIFTNLPWNFNTVSLEADWAFNPSNRRPSGTVLYRLTHPSLASIEGDYASGSINLNTQGMIDIQATVARIDSPWGQAEDFQGNARIASNGTVEAQGTVARIDSPWGQAEDFQGNARIVSNGTVEAQGTVARVKNPWADASDLTFLGHHDPGGSSRLALSSAQLTSAWLPAPMTRNFIGGKVMRVDDQWHWDECELLIGENRFWSSGRVGTNSLAGQVSGQFLPGFWTTNLPPALATGPITLEAEIAGSPGHPLLDAKLLWQDLNWSRADGIPRPPLTLSSRLEYDGNHADLFLDNQGWPQKLPTLRLKVPARVSLFPWRMERNDKAPDWTLSLQSQGDLETLAGLIDFGGLHARGRWDCDLTIVGPLTAPAVKGRFEFKQGYAEYPPTGTLLRDIDFAVEGLGDKLVLHHARLKDGEKGLVEMEGELALAPKERFPLSVALRVYNLTLWRTGKSRLGLSGACGLTGPLPSPILAGQFGLGNTHIALDQPYENIVTLPVTGLDQPARKFKADPFKAPGGLRLDLVLLADEPVTVEGRGLRSEWDVDLHLGGDSGNPIVSGSIYMIDGEFFFMGRRFELREAIISFESVETLMPVIHAGADARHGGIDAYLDMIGPLSEPSIALYSNPDLPPEEIVSRLLFGQSSHSISAFQAARLAYGLEVLRGGRNTLELLDRGQGLIHADEVEFLQDESSGATAIAVGKKLHSRITLRGEKGIGETGDKVSVQLELRPQLILETEAGTNMREGIGIRWRRDY